MKLYLSSIGILNGAALLSMLTDKAPLSVAVIPNAWDVYPQWRRQLAIEDLLDRFKQLDIAPKIIDIATVQSTDLKNELSEHSLVWIMGGNSFYLNYLLHQSKLPDIIVPLLTKGLVYGGESAGAMLAGTTLHGVEWLDDAEKSPELLWDGLNLVDFGIIPHWGAKKYGEKLQSCKDEMEQYATVTRLTNDQVLIVDGDNVRVIDAIKK